MNAEEARPTPKAFTAETQRAQRKAKAKLIGGMAIYILLGGAELARRSQP